VAFDNAITALGKAKAARQKSDITVEESTARLASAYRRIEMFKIPVEIDSIFERNCA
jgi:hypothetical protein